MATIYTSKNDVGKRFGCATIEARLVARHKRVARAKANVRRDQSEWGEQVWIEVTADEQKTDLFKSEGSYYVLDLITRDAGFLLEPE